MSFTSGWGRRSRPSASSTTAPRRRPATPRPTCSCATAAPAGRPSATAGSSTASAPGDCGRLRSARPTGCSASSRRAVERLLADAWGARADLVRAEILAGRYAVRVTSGDGRRAVVKRPRDDPGGRWGAASHGFDVEWAGLDHLAAMPEPVAPALLGGDRELRVIVLEDLAVERTLADALLGTDADQARADVVGLGAALGSLHGWSVGRADELAGSAPPTGSPAAPDRTWWADVVRAERAPFHDALDRLGFGGLAGAALERDLDVLDGALAGGRIRGFVHGDPAPTMWWSSAERCRLVDVERSSPGSVPPSTRPTCSPRFPAAGASAGFRPTWRAQRWPPTGRRWRTTASGRRRLGGGAGGRARRVRRRPWPRCRRRVPAGRGRRWRLGHHDAGAARAGRGSSVLSAPAAADALPRRCAVARVLRERVGAAWPGDEIPHYPPFAPGGGGGRAAARHGPTMTGRPTLRLN